MPKMFLQSTMFLIFFFAHENMKKPASKVDKPAQIQPKSQFMFHKNLPPATTGLLYNDFGCQSSGCQIVLMLQMSVWNPCHLMCSF